MAGTCYGVTGPKKALRTYLENFVAYRHTHTLLYIDMPYIGRGINSFVLKWTGDLHPISTYKYEIAILPSSCYTLCIWYMLSLLIYIWSKLGHFLRNFGLLLRTLLNLYHLKRVLLTKIPYQAPPTQWGPKSVHFGKAHFFMFCFFTAVPKNGQKTVQSSKNAEKWPKPLPHLVDIAYKDKS